MWGIDGEFFAKRREVKTDNVVVEERIKWDLKIAKNDLGVQVEGRSESWW